ncbi:MAG: DUF6093 family protein [Eubacteriales bacterium]
MAAAAMTADAQFRRISGGPAPWPVPEDWDGGAEVLWETQVRLQELKREGVSDHAEQPTYTRQYLISAPLGGPVLRVGEHGDTARINGRTFRLTSEMQGSLLWSRDFIAVLNETQEG